MTPDFRNHQLILATISTGHIHPETDAALRAQLEVGRGPLVELVAYFVNADAGWNIFVSDEQAAGARDAGYPELATILEHCVEQGIDRLVLDPDSSTVPGLPVFDWETEDAFQADRSTSKGG